MFCITWSYSYVFALFVYLDHISKHSLESKHLILYCHAQKNPTGAWVYADVKELMNNLNNSGTFLLRNTHTYIILYICILPHSPSANLCARETSADVK